MGEPAILYSDLTHAFTEQFVCRLFKDQLSQADSRATRVSSIFSCLNARIQSPLPGILISRHPPLDGWYASNA
jgi:hypothetical protein